MSWGVGDSSTKQESAKKRAWEEATSHPRPCRVRGLRLAEGVSFWRKLRHPVVLSGEPAKDAGRKNHLCSLGCRAPLAFPTAGSIPSTGDASLVCALTEAAAAVFSISGAPAGVAAAPIAAIAILRRLLGDPDPTPARCSITAGVDGFIARWLRQRGVVAAESAPLCCQFSAPTPSFPSELLLVLPPLVRKGVLRDQGNHLPPSVPGRADRESRREGRS